MNEHLDKEIIAKIAKEMKIDEALVIQAVNSQFLLVRYVMQNEPERSVKLPFFGKFMRIKRGKEIDKNNDIDV